MRTVWSALLVVARLAVLAVLAAMLTTSSASALDINTEVSLPDALVGEPYTFQFEGEEGCAPFHFYYLAGGVPGLEVTYDGRLTGTPTQAGTFTFWVELDDGIPGGACHSPVPSQGEYTLIVAPRIEITAETLPGAKVGRAYNSAVTAIGGGSLAWSVSEGSLPPGLSLNRDTGALTGTPSAVGSFPFSVKVSDDKRRATRQYTFVVAAPLGARPSVSLSAAEVGVPLTAVISSTGGIGPLAWSVATGSLPGGLSLDAGKGVIQGTPTSAGSFSVPVTVSDSDGETAKLDVKLNVAARLAIASTRVAKATTGTSYRLRLVARGGVGPRVWKLTGGSLPKGLALGRAGTLAGTPRVAGTYRFVVRLTDKLGAAATRAITLTVAPRS